MKKRTVLFAIAALAALPLASVPASAQQRPLVVGTDIEVKPFDFAQNGTYVGFDQDLWAEIGKEIGRSTTVKPMDFSALVPALQTSGIDAAIASIFITDARKQVVDFSTPYYVSSNGALLLSTDTGTKGVKDLDGKPIASVTGSAGAKWAKDNLPGSKLSLFPAITGAFLELRAGRAAAIVYDHPSLAYYATTDGKGAVRLLTDPVGEKIPVGIAFPKGSPLVGPVNAALEKIRADGRYDRIYAKWFGAVSN